jgi:hypothetical protein
VELARAAILYWWFAISPNRYGGVRVGSQRGASRLKPRTPRRLSCISLLDRHGRIKNNQKLRPHPGPLERVHARQPTRRDLVALVYQQSSPFKASKDERLSQRSSCMDTSRTNWHPTGLLRAWVLTCANMCSTTCVLSTHAHACHAPAESTAPVPPPGVYNGKR